MLRTAAVSAATAAVWLLALLGPGLSLAAEDNPEPDFSLCSHCFYRQTPPRGASAGPPLRPRCHTPPGGQAFATLSKPTCDTAVYSAFHLSHEGTDREGQEEGELVTGNVEGKAEVAVPALLRGGEDPSNPGSPTDSPLQLWDSTITSLVQSSIKPQCSTAGGDLYILTGAGSLKAADDEDSKCQTVLLWSAVCCAVPEGKSGFTLGLIRESGDGERKVSVKELEEMLGLEELFSEDCGGASEENVEIPVSVIGQIATGSTEKASDPNIRFDNTENLEEEVGSDSASQVSDDAGKDSDEAPTTVKMAAGVDAQPDEDEADITQEISSGATTSEGNTESQRDVTQTRAFGSESPESAPEDETVDEQETDTNSSSTLVFVLSTTMSILKAPLRPMFSKVTELPGQVEFFHSVKKHGLENVTRAYSVKVVTYVLQEDLGVLSALPGDTYSLLHLLTSDLLSWMGTAADMVLGIGETCFSSMYYCSSSMVGALLNSCYTGVTGVGTLAGDTVGIFGNALDNSWWVTKFFGGRLWEHSEGYVGTMMSEMGGQAKAVGGGFGNLAWRSGNGVGKIFRLGWEIVMGMVDIVINTVREAFGQE